MPSEIPTNSTTLTHTGLNTDKAVGVLTKKELAVVDELDTGVLSKKELALETAGATREASYKAMVAALEARSMTVDKFGDEHFTEDHSSRLKAAELISRLNGDLKTSEVVVDNRSVVVTGVTTEVLGELLHMVKDVAVQLRSLAASGRQTGEVISVQAEGAHSDTAS